MEKSMPMPQPAPPGFVPGASSYAPPPPPPYQDNFQQPPNVVIIGTPAFGPESQHLTCPHCHSSISTSVETEANTKTHLFALLLCIIGCWCCAPCPYCMDSCMVKKHYCPSCKSFLGQTDN